MPHLILGVSLTRCIHKHMVFFTWMASLLLKVQVECLYTLSWNSFLCNKQIDNDDVNSFDITQVRDIFTTEVYFKPQPSNDSRDDVSRPKKRIRRSKDSNVPNFSDNLIGLKGGADIHNLKGATPLSATAAIMRKHLQYLNRSQNQCTRMI